MDEGLKVSNNNELSRRSFFKGAVAGAAALQGPALIERAALAAENVNPATPTPSPTFDFTKDSNALQADKVVDSACQFCNCNCRLKVHLKAGRIIDITGETADPVQAGGICVKGPMMAQLVYNPRRLTRPLKRVAGEKGSPDSKFEPVSWDEALGLVARKLIELRDAGEARAIANKTSGRLPRGTGSLVNRFFTLLGSPNDTDVGPVCNDAGGDALAWTFGLGNFTNGYGVDPSTGKEDLGASRFYLFFGTNQAETQPVTFAHLLRGRAKSGAKLVVADPRLTPTGAQADTWIAPKPHTDLAIVLAMLHEVIRNNLYDPAFVAKWVLGFDELARHVIERQYTPDWAEDITGVPAAKIRQLAEDYGRAKPASIFCNAGISHQLGAFDTYRALAFLAAITGNIGVAGGGCNFMHNTWPGDLHLPAIAGNPPTKDVALPVGPDAFADAILDGKPYPLKAVLTCGNPILGSANTAKVREAYRKLPFYVYTGLFMEEAAYFADVILPVCSGLEMETVYMRRDDRAIRWQRRAVAPVGESKPDWVIWIDLAHAMAKADRKNPPEYWTKNFPAEWRDYRNLWQTFVSHTPGAGGMTAERMEPRAEPLRWPCPTADHPGVSTLYLVAIASQLFTCLVQVGVGILVIGLVSHLNLPISRGLIPHMIIWFVGALVWGGFGLDTWFRYRRWGRVPRVLAVDESGLVFSWLGWWRMREKRWAAEEISSIDLRVIRGHLNPWRTVAILYVRHRKGMARRFRLSSADPELPHRIARRLSEILGRPMNCRS